jgi:hypothetical protein
MLHSAAAVPEGAELGPAGYTYLDSYTLRRHLCARMAATNGPALTDVPSVGVCN